MKVHAVVCFIMFALRKKVMLTPALEVDHRVDLIKIKIENYIQNANISVV